MTDSSAASLVGTAGTTLADALAEQALARPTRTFIRTQEASVDYLQADRLVDSYAAGLQRAGILAGDRVLLIMDSTIEQVIVWFALNRIGAVNIPLNPGLTADILSRSMRMVEPVAVVIDAAHAGLLSSAFAENGARGRLPVYVNPHDQDSWRQLLPGSEPLAALEIRDERPRRVETDELATATMLFTSGSTGVPKACELSHRYLLRQAQLHANYLRFREDDVLYTPFPLFHIDGATLTVGAALVSGATAALSKRFSASRYWDEVRASGATVFNFMGATANMLWKRPPSDQDRDHSVRLAWGVPMPACEPHWRARFGFDLVEVYGLTDAGVPAYQPLDQPRTPGSCGRIIPEYRVRIADADGNEVPTGDTGEILIRSDEPGLVMNGYYAMPEATERAFRGGWFHTGDFGRVDSVGNLYFVTRSKDVIRRRGENIAAADIESAMDRHPRALETAAVAVPSELSEDDIRVFVVPRPGQRPAPHELVEHARAHLPRHMVPRYIDIVDELPKTPTEKIERFRLSALPLTPDSWDVDRCAPFDPTARTGKELTS
ncbi:AMP-binding protein [Streptomyces sp. SID8361]|uniref:AMP-binding protein n=1 Tax=Streptomyces sp. MnatMP-M27 TaxID=1839768 RepID=UPI00081E551F|nr:AMP-binding protein [Streptomyces sp. MnatMP-M27]MYU11086.1 AMP-binding protein [Streptomyces sp. SID8361]SCF78162.1 crotonobetaine/carnitine-CoA ligase [Streptomyces sp. MnatMP-M27]